MFDNKIILEVAVERSSILKKIDDNFFNLKRDIGNKEYKSELIKNIKEFTGIKNVTFTLKKDSTEAWIIPLYNQTFVLKISELFKQKNESDSIETADKDFSKHIDRIFICFGYNLINKCSPRQLTAILLHEIGHIYAHSGNYAHYVWWLSRKLRILNSALLYRFVLPGTFFLVVILSLVSRSLTFFEHYGEYHADEYAAKYGYGDELAKVLHNFHLEITRMEERNKKDSFFSKIYDMVYNIFITHEHPDRKDRICNLLNKIMTEYKERYPRNKDVLNIIFGNLKCEPK
jgi:hypothetical protein